MAWKVPLFDLKFDDQEFAAVEKVLKSGWLTMGEETCKFEKEFSEYIGIKYALATSSCTAALHMAMLALDIGPKDEVICPSLTFVATSNSILYTGARPIFADVTSLKDLNISPKDIEKKITDKTKAIVVVHYAGYPCNMDEICTIAQKYGLYVIEDCAHAPGAEYKGKKVGTFGDIACFSFFSNKNLSTGEGGMVVTDNSELYEKLKLIRSHGMTTLTLDRHKGHAFSYDVVCLGFNYRIDEIRAAIGRVQLKKLDLNNQKRKEIVNYYIKKLSKFEFISIPFKDYKEKSSYHIFPVLLNKKISRINLMKYLRDNGIQTSIHYRPIHQFSFYQKLGYTSNGLDFTEIIGEKELTLPLYPNIGYSQIDYIVSILEQYLC